MWCPKDYYSWSSVVGELQETANNVLSLATNEEKLANFSPHESARYVSEVFHREKTAESWRIANSNLVITAVYLLVNFVREYPPLLANLNGSKIVPEWPLISHRDQFDLCLFDWPLSSNPHYSAFFERREIGDITGAVLLERFTYIDAETGRLRRKNGSKNFLVNGLGLKEATADAYEELVHEISDYVLCWPSVPEGKEWRDFLSCLHANDAFGGALNALYGPPSVGSGRPELVKRLKSVGRPSRQAEVRSVYFRCFPDGHSVIGISWKEALVIVNSGISSPVSEDTLKRSVVATQ